MCGTKPLSGDKPYQRKLRNCLLSRNSFTEGGRVQGLFFPAPSPFAPRGVTYTFLVTGRAADCMAASLPAPARTHPLQPGQPGGSPTLSMHSHHFFYTNNAVSGGKRATRPPLG